MKKEELLCNLHEKNIKKFKLFYLQIIVFNLILLNFNITTTFLTMIYIEALFVMVFIIIKFKINLLNNDFSFDKVDVKNKILLKILKFNLFVLFNLLILIAFFYKINFSYNFFLFKNSITNNHNTVFKNIITYLKYTFLLVSILLALISIIFMIFIFNVYSIFIYLYASLTLFLKLFYKLLKNKLLLLYKYIKNITWVSIKFICNIKDVFLKEFKNKFLNLVYFKMIFFLHSKKEKIYLYYKKNNL
ncbi:hypothetical protein SLITO_v1c03870 [Spiroplasma litorale]|uniref:Uncharacterized protein n=1 Tax=Spiroplasma litorale TaxID=216942 RepID=A0A0K1W135_9MOLU|nr:hypothetical protein SLITO_v1c03870 [Spiroplasma litorale]